MSCVPLKKWKTKLIIQSTRHIIRYAQSACHVSNSAQSRWSGAKIKESYFTRLESKLFFYRGLTETRQNYGGKEILTQEYEYFTCEKYKRRIHYQFIL